MERAVGEPRGLQLLEGELAVVAAQRRVGQQDRVLAGAAGLRHAFGAGERRVPGEQLGGVGQPVRVVGVEHVVVALELRLLRRTAGCPGRVAVGSSTHSFIGSLPSSRMAPLSSTVVARPPDDTAACQPAIASGDRFGRRSGVGVPRPAVGGGGHGVHPRDAVGGAVGVDELVHARRPCPCRRTGRGCRCCRCWRRGSCTPWRRSSRTAGSASARSGCRPHRAGLRRSVPSAAARRP